MALYFIEYDVRSTNHDYKPLYAELIRFDAVRVLKSLWCFKRINTTAGNLRNHFREYVHKDDGIAVIEASNWGTVNAEKTPNDLK